MSNKRARLPAVKHLGLLAVVLSIITACLLMVPAAPIDAAVPETVTIYAKVYGEEAVPLKSYTKSALEALGAENQKFTVVDAMPSVCIVQVYGVTLEKIFSDVGIETSVIDRIVYSADGDAKKKELPGRTLLGQNRYCYSNLQNHYYVAGKEVKGVEGWDSGAAVVKPMLSLTEHWTRVSDGGDINQAELDLKDEQGFRFFLGMVDLSSQADIHIYWVNNITLTLEGSASTVVIDGNRPDLKVDDQVQLTATVTGPLAQYYEGDMTWTSSNPSAATVDSKTGLVTILTDDPFIITAVSNKDQSVSGSLPMKVNSGNGNTDGNTDDNTDDNTDGNTDETSPSPSPPTIYGGGGSGGSGSGSGSTGGVLGTVAKKVSGVVSSSGAATDAPAGYVPVDLDTSRVIDVGGGSGDSDGTKQRAYKITELGSGDGAGELIEMENNPLLAFTAAAAAILFVIGGLGRGIKYIKDMGGFYVLRGKFNRRPSVGGVGS